jgi:hypothetical protein
MCNNRLSISATILVILLLANCSRNDSVLVKSPANKAEGLFNNDSSNAMVQKTWERIFFKYIDDRIKDAGIKSLKEQEILPNSKEIRIWAGTFPPFNGLIIKDINGQWSALYLPSIDSSSSNKSLMFLPAPKSGWSSLWQKLDALDIFTLPDGVDVGDNIAYTDLKGVIIEVKTADSYRAYMYSSLEKAQTPEAKKVLSICNTLSNEFEVTLY